MKGACIALLLSIIALSFGQPKCPIREENKNNCVIVDPTPARGQVSGIAAFEYKVFSRNRPSNWGRLDCKTGRFAKFRGCTYCRNTCFGRSQSPINIIVRKAIKAPFLKAPIVRPGANAPVVFETTPGNFELLCEKKDHCGHTMFNGKRFRVDNVHMHHFSEHRLNRKRYPLEMHLVHTSGDKTLVVAVFYKAGSFNPELQKFLNIASKKCRGSINLLKLLLPAISRKELTSYTGSLTTPPCTEGVQWVVSRKMLQASRSQINTFKKLIANQIDSRPRQPLNGRKVTLYS